MCTFKKQILSILLHLNEIEHDIDVHKHDPRHGHMLFKRAVVTVAQRYMTV